MAHALSDIVLNSGDAAEFVIHQITSLTHNQNATLSVIKGTGGVVPVSHVQGDTKPASQIQTTDTSLLTLRTNRWLAAGWCADQAASIVPWNKRANCSTYDPGNVHGGFSANPVFVVPRSITGQGSNPVEISADLLYLSAANNLLSPLTLLSTQALRPSSFAEVSQLGRAYVRGVQIPELTGFSVNLNITIDSKPNGGGVFPDTAYITAIETQIEFTVEDIDRAASVLNATDTAAGGGTVIYLAKKQPGATVYPFANTVHKSITALSGIENSNTINFSDGANGTGTITISANNPTGANAGDLLTVATGVAIP